MTAFAACWDARNMTSIREIDCPECGEKDGIEVFERDGLTVGESRCRKCGYEIPEEVHLEEYERLRAMAEDGRRYIESMEKR